MKTFKQYITELTTGDHAAVDNAFSQGKKAGNSYTVHKPGHEFHGKQGKLIRQQGANYGVEVGGKLDYFKHNELK